MKPTVTLNSLSTGYYNRGVATVIGHDLTASLRRGELTCLLGPNGAGKSTLLRTITGFQPPVEGEVVINGRPLANYSPAELSRTVGVVLTERMAFGSLTVEEVVGMGRSPYTDFWGKMTETDHRLVAEAMALVGITGLSGRMSQTLSDGERQKMMIAKAIAQQTPVIVLDEPTAFLDYPSKVEIMLLLRKLARERGLTVLLSTHDVELAMQISDRVWLLDREHGLVAGTAEDLSLDGSIEHCFDREGIEFDAVNGRFVIETPTVGTIRIEGEEGRRKALLIKALRRHGITPGAAGDIVTVSGDGFEYQGRHFESVGSLLDVISQRQRPEAEVG